MSIVGLNSGLLPQFAESPSPAEQLMADLTQLAQDLKSGNISAMQQDYVTLSQDLADTVTSGAPAAVESGVIVSLLSDLLSFPLAPAEVPPQIILHAAALNYGAPSFVPGGTRQSDASSTSSPATNPTSSQRTVSTSQSVASNTASSPGTFGSNAQGLATARTMQADDGAIPNKAISPGASSSSSAPIPDQAGQPTTAALTGASASGFTPSIPVLNPDNSGILPWNLFDWQLSTYRNQPLPPEFLRKRKSPRGSAARTRNKRRKP